MNDKHTVFIEKLIPGGKGLTRIDGKAVFVPYVLSGEKVEISIIKEKKSYCEAELIKVTEPSPHRVEPLCPLYMKCGGCNLQHISYEAQLTAKVDFATNLLSRNGGIRLDEIPIIPSKPYGYRNRVQVHFNGTIKGFKERSGNAVIPVTNCPVAVNGINSFLSEKSTSSSVERMNIFGTEQWYSTDLEKKDISVEIDGKNIHFNSSLFFQSNLSVLPELKKYVNEHVKGQKLLDLYCGVGLLSHFAQDNVKEVEAVELIDRVSPYISKNISVPHSFHPSSLENWVKKKGQGQKADVIIVDPPRTGLSKIVRNYLTNSSAETILYISCDPATMSRDLKDLLADNYTMKDFRLFDFYPQTSHMEAAALLKKI